MAMKFVKQNFMGIELDVLVGHSEFDLLFVATQVARVAGLKDPSVAVRDHRKTKHGSTHGRMLQTLMGESPISRPEDHLGRCLRSNTVMFTESEVYAMLLRSRAPQTEPFRKWVTEEVLPSIRKGGREAGLKDPKGTVRQYAPKASTGVLRVSDVLGDNLSSMRPARKWVGPTLTIHQVTYDKPIGYVPVSPSGGIAATEWRYRCFAT